MILIAGPCVIENDDMLYAIAKELEMLTVHLPRVDFYFKASCVKDNRTKLSNFYGPGFERGIELLNAVRGEYDIKITTDFHTVEQIKKYGKSVDLIQIPAFLARQTSLIVAASRCSVPINVKKPQFMSPYDIQQISDKIYQINSDAEVFITDRGTCFGYNHWMCDPRHFRIMKSISSDIKVIADVTHPNQGFNDHTFAYELGMSAIASGADGLFLETHLNPLDAKCDAINQIPVKGLYNYLTSFNKLFDFTQNMLRPVNVREKR